MKILFALGLLASLSYLADAKRVTSPVCSVIRKRCYGMGGPAKPFKQRMMCEMDLFECIGLHEKTCAKDCVPKLQKCRKDFNNDADELRRICEPEWILCYYEKCKPKEESAITYTVKEKEQMCVSTKDVCIKAAGIDTRKILNCDMDFLQCRSLQVQTCSKECVKMLTSCRQSAGLDIQRMLHCMNTFLKCHFGHCRK